MTMRFLQAGLLLALAVSFGVAQDAPEAPAATAIKPLELYRVQGRAWSHRIVEWKRGSPVRIKLETGKVTESNAETADYSTDYVLRGGGESGGASRRIYFDHDLKGDAKAWADDTLAEETLELSFGKFVCRRHVTESDGVRTTTWVSAEFHPLVVKQVKLGTDTCEIRTLTSFDSQVIDPWALYRVAGRSWTVRTTMHMEGMDPMVSYLRQTVAEVHHDRATISMQMLDSDKQPFEGVPANELHVSFTEPGADTVAEPQRVREKIKCEAGEFECNVFETEGTKIWTSVQWPTMIIRSETDQIKSELVEFNLGHDPLRLYRTAGNYSVVRSVTNAGGMRIEVTTRTEVTKVEGTDVTYTVSQSDNNGNDFGTTEQTMSLGNDGPSGTAYTGQVEQTITTPAGTFRCVRQEIEVSDIMTQWMYHGVIVRSEMRSNNMTMTQELLELNME